MRQSDNSEACPPSDTTVEIRPFRAQDGPALIDLWVAVWRATLPAIDFEARRGWIASVLADAEWRTLVVVLADDPVGFATREGETLHQLVVAIGAQGRGIARCLLDGVKAESPAGLVLEVNQDNPRAVRFYEREGFRRIGQGTNPASGLATWTMRWPSDDRVTP